jgi:AraC-like DNA-binding protein
VNNIILICYLLWRVETLSDLSISVHDAEEPVTSENVEDHAQSSTVRNNIGPLLKQYCEEPRLYLQYDISVAQLAKLIGTNRVYLSKYFAMQGSTYNAYINGLRIQHFVQLYHEAVAAGQPVIAKQLAYQSGFRSYSTFSAVFKQTMGTTVTAWMNGMTE